MKDEVKEFRKYPFLQVEDKHAASNKGEPESVVPDIDDARRGRDMLITAEQ